MSAPDLPAIAAALDALEDRLRARYGWTHLALELHLDDGGRRLRVLGEIAVHGLRAAVRECVAARCPAPVELALELRPIPARSWHIVPASVELGRHHPSRGPFELASELLPDDGPLALLARDGDAALVRARDGTVGWVAGSKLGEAIDPRPIPPPNTRDDGGEAVLAAARSYLGVAYELGGTTRRRIDCSALVQRAYASALGLVLPKNSNDQLAAFGGGAALERPDERVRPGDLLFMHSRAEDRTHVGVASEAGTVVQASRSRSQVVEVPVADYLDDARWLRWVPGEEILAWARTQVGRAHVELPWR